LTPPSLLRVVLSLARLSLRRRLNRISHIWSKGRRGKRSGTARKSPGSLAGLLVMGLVFFFQVTMISSLLVGRVGDELRTKEPTARPHRVERALPGEDLWPGPEHADRMHAALGLVLTGVALSVLFSSLGGKSPELAQPSWSMEWLFTFPVEARGLFLAKIGEYALTDIFGWLATLPFLFTVFVASGYGGAAVPLALLGTLYMNVVVGALRILCEAALRKRLSLARLRNLQGTATILGMLLLLGLFYVAYGSSGASRIVAVASALPDALLWQPLSAPLLLGKEPLAVGAVLVGFALAITLVAVWTCERIVRGGLVTVSGPSSTRSLPARPAPSPGPFLFPRLRGIVGKEIRVLLRDRNYFVQTLIVPIMIIGFQAVVNPHLLSSRGDGRTAAVVAFAVGAYALAFGGFSVLSVEGPSLWLLFTLPQPLDRILRKKVVLWGSLAAVYTVAVLALWWRAAPTPRALLDPVLALLGVFLFAFLAGGMGALGTDPLETEPQRRVRPEWMLLYMVLAAILGHGIYTEAVWPKLASFVLLVLLAYALWDRVRERLPLLLDPTQMPPPRIALSDALVAALVFFELQQMFFLVAAAAGGGSLEVGVFYSYLGAGAVTVALTLYTFWRTNVPSPLRGVGLLRDRADGAGVARALVVGAGLGAAAAVFARMYLSVAHHFGPLRRLMEETPSLRLDSSLAAAGLAVVLAPLFEEFIFRGLLFRSLRRVTRLPLAVLGSAAVFAIIHPPISFLPVFVLGVVAALAFDRTRLLWAPIAAHAVYNAALVVWPPS
jgi:ABC-2 type transport system permease protein